MRRVWKKKKEKRKRKKEADYSGKAEMTQAEFMAVGDARRAAF